MSLISETVSIFACALLAVCFTGCSGSGDPVGSVEGTITLKGDAYSDCRAGIFCPETALNLGARIEPDGVFKIPNVPPGNYSVFVFPIPKENTGKGPDPPDTSPIPKKLRKQNTTDVTVDVVANEVNKVSIELAK